MVKVWQANSNPPHDVLSDPLGHIGGLPCRRHAQHSTRLARAQVIRWKSAKAIYYSAGGSDSRGRSGDRCRPSFVRQDSQGDVQAGRRGGGLRRLDAPGTSRLCPTQIRGRWIPDRDGMASMDDGKATGHNAPRRAQLKWLVRSGMRGGRENRRVSRTLQDGLRNESAATSYLGESTPRVESFAPALRDP